MAWGGLCPSQSGTAFLDASTVGWLAAVAAITAIGAALVATRALMRAERDDRGAATRVVVGAIVASALAVICLAWLGGTGAGAMLVVGVCARFTARAA